MKQINLLGILFFMVMVFLSCSKKDESTPSPVANFTMTGGGSPAPATIVFINKCQNATSYVWNFGDGSVLSNVNSPTHIYQTAGNFNVSLIATGDGGKDSITKSVTIAPPPAAPVANFTYTGANTPAPCAITFTNTSQNATSYVWNFGDGSATVTDANPVHTYIAANTYNVSLIATGTGGIDTIIQAIHILSPNPLPIASFTFTGANKPAPCTVTFTNTSQNATSYNWNFGDGSTATTKNPTHIYTSGGVFSVTLTATGAGGTDVNTQSVNILQGYTKAFIKKVSVSAIPFINPSTGTGWDSSTGPDVYFKITNSSGYVYYDGSGSIVWDVTQGMLPISWTFASPYYQVPDFNANFYIDLYDYDFPSSDDYIGWCGGFLMSSYSSYPATVSKTANGITVTLDIQWQ
jgi:PKD repeat protein